MRDASLLGELTIGRKQEKGNKKRLPSFILTPMEPDL
jgi:hypothetical protein